MTNIDTLLETFTQDFKNLKILEELLEHPDLAEQFEQSVERLARATHLRLANEKKRALSIMTKTATKLLDEKRAELNPANILIKIALNDELTFKTIEELTKNFPQAATKLQEDIEAIAPTINFQLRGKVTAAVHKVKTLASTYLAEEKHKVACEPRESELLDSMLEDDRALRTLEKLQNLPEALEKFDADVQQLARTTNFNARGHVVSAIAKLKKLARTYLAEEEHKIACEPRESELLDSMLEDDRALRTLEKLQNFPEAFEKFDADVKRLARTTNFNARSFAVTAIAELKKLARTYLAEEEHKIACEPRESELLDLLFKNFQALEAVEELRDYPAQIQTFSEKVQMLARTTNFTGRVFISSAVNELKILAFDLLEETKPKQVDPRLITIPKVAHAPKTEVPKVDMNAAATEKTEIKHFRDTAAASLRMPVEASISEKNTGLSGLIKTLVSAAKNVFSNIFNRGDLSKTFSQQTGTPASQNALLLTNGITTLSPAA